MSTQHQSERALAALRELQADPGFADQTWNAKIQALAEHNSTFMQVKGRAYLGTHFLGTSGRALFVFNDGHIITEFDAGAEVLFRCVAYEYNKRLPISFVSALALELRYLPTSREQAARICPAILWDDAFAVSANDRS